MTPSLDVVLAELEALRRENEELRAQLAPQSPSDSTEQLMALIVKRCSALLTDATRPARDGHDAAFVAQLFEVTGGSPFVAKAVWATHRALLREKARACGVTDAKTLGYQLRRLKPCPVGGFIVTSLRARRGAGALWRIARVDRCMTSTPASSIGA